MRELRAGNFDANTNTFTPVTIAIDDGGGTIGPRTLVNLRATCPAFDNDPSDTGTNPSGAPNVYNFPNDSVVEMLANASPAVNVTTFRFALNTLGDGFVEAIPDQTIEDISQQQCTSSGDLLATADEPAGPCGEFIMDAVLQDQLDNNPDDMAVGRFGWKDQHADLLTFSGDAYIHEIGITNRLFPTEVTDICNPSFVPEPNDPGGDPATGQFADIDMFTEFMRASKAPPRDEKLINSDPTDVAAGQQLLSRRPAPARRTTASATSTITRRFRVRPRCPCFVRVEED